MLRIFYLRFTWRCNVKLRPIELLGGSLDPKAVCRALGKHIADMYGLANSPSRNDNSRSRSCYEANASMGARISLPCSSLCRFPISDSWTVLFLQHGSPGTRLHQAWRSMQPSYRGRGRCRRVHQRVWAGEYLGMRMSRRTNSQLQRDPYASDSFRHEYGSRHFQDHGHSI